jgi:signal transduction histidine kinase
MTLFVGTSCIILAFSIYFYQKDNLDKNNVNMYRSMTSTMANTLIEMEIFTENLMISSLQHFQMIEKKKGLMNTDQLVELRKYLGVSDLFVTTKEGKYIRATNKPIPFDQPNLFSFCSGYRDLVYGDKKMAVTPILIAYPKGSGTYKFMMMPNHDKSMIVEVAMKLDFIVRILKNSAKSYPELLSIGLYTPSGESLGEYSVNENEVKDSSIHIPDGIEYVENNDETMTVWRKVESQDENCCECQVKALTANSSKYFYILKAKISRKPVLAAVASMKKTIILLCLWIMLAGMFVSLILSKWILLNLTKFVSKIEKYLEGLLPSREVILNSNDEIGFLSKTFSQMLANLEITTQVKIDNEALRAQAKNLEEKAYLASQVSHDIRSPLSALNIIMTSATALSEDKRILARTAIQRINDIANSLLEKGKSYNPQQKNGNKCQEVYLLTSLVDSILSEKRIQFREYIDVAIESDLSHCYGVFVNTNHNELKRVISNLINNSVEAFSCKKGTVFVSVKDLHNKVQIEIKDTGKGISQELLEKLGAKGVSAGKEGMISGSGLGIFHAKSFLEKSGGTLSIASKLNEGTTIRLVLNKESAPCWFVDSLRISENFKIVILDDDQSIHNIWKNRLKFNDGILKNIELFHFTSGDLFTKWFLENDKSKQINMFLIDFELLNQNKTGLDVIEQLRIQNLSILVTSRFDESAVLERCKRNSIRLLPKLLAGIVPIEVLDTNKVLDCELVKKLEVF